MELIIVWEYRQMEIWKDGKMDRMVNRKSNGCTDGKING